MKNILLLGASRAGKTTFTRMLRKKYSEYQIIREDSIREAYSQVISKDDSLSIDEVGQTEKYTNFIVKVC